MSYIAEVVEGRFKELETSAHALLKLAVEKEARSGPAFSLSGFEPRSGELDEEEEEERGPIPTKVAKAPVRDARVQWALGDVVSPLSSQNKLERAIASHIQGLASFKSEIEGLIQKENKRAFWNGFWLNALFFVLGLGASAVPVSAERVWGLIGLR
jgi:hypothetical protein